jgi:hypothetical protein
MHSEFPPIVIVTPIGIASNVTLVAQKSSKHIEGLDSLSSFQAPSVPVAMREDNRSIVRDSASHTAGNDLREFRVFVDSRHAPS